MRFLEINELVEWCKEHKTPIGEQWYLDPPKPSSILESIDYGQGGQSGREPAIAAKIVSALTGWQECLVWVTQWGVWPSSEDWPAFYAWRGAHSERRSLETAPGHLFTESEEEPLIKLLTLIMENAWDAHILLAHEALLTETAAFVSHDGCVVMYRLD